MSDTRKDGKFTVQQKAELVLSFRGERSIAEICREHDISETLLRRWRDQMVEAGMERFAAGQDRSRQAEQRRQIAQIERALGKKTMELEQIRPFDHRPPVRPAFTGWRHHPREIQRLVFVAAEADRAPRDP